ncbi:MAG: type II secretion system protein [Verrucomicrobiota bacterium]
MHKAKQYRAAFTLVEMMVVVVVIGILAAMILPAFVRVRQSAQNTRFINDARQFGAALDIYMTEVGLAPDDFSSGAILSPLDEYIKPSDFSGTSPIGGVWDIEGGDSGIWYAAVGVHNFTIDADQVQKIDDTYDDGNLSTGRIQADGGSRIYWIVEE